MRKGVITVKKKGTFDQQKYIRMYMKSHYTRLTVLFSKEKEADMIDHLEQQSNKSEYVKQLIRSDMEQ